MHSEVSDAQGLGFLKRFEQGSSSRSFSPNSDLQHLLQLKKDLLSKYGTHHSYPPDRTLRRAERRACQGSGAENRPQQRTV